MKLFIIAKPNAKTDKVERIDETHFRVSVKAPPDEGKANAAVIEALAEFLGVPRSRLEIKTGHKSKQKLVVLN